MGDRSRVVWSEGMFLRPQHFQQAQRYQEFAQHQLLLSAQGHFWGFHSLQLDAAKLTEALAADANAVSGVFASEAGVAVKLGDYLQERLSSTGELAARDASIASRRKDLERQQETLEARMQVIQARYLKQFSALDSMLSQMQSTSNYLTQQLSGLSNLNNS
jgi:flagellar hook-associated protein 2